MCGIAGFYGFKNYELIKKFSKELEHRGPDGEGFYMSDEVTLLNRRLAIIDRKGGDQPIYNEDKSVVVTYNGEIYNYRELREDLEKKGHSFTTKSDTEIIVHGYEEWGIDCFDKLNGMFAIALYDLKLGKLLLVRDHFGIKPLYYSIFKSVLKHPQVMFSSEIKPLINSGLIKKKPNEKIMYRYLRYRVHDDQRDTFFTGIFKLMPGEVMQVSDSRIDIKKYSNLEENLLNQPEKKLTTDNINLFKNELIKAIRLRLISEVPVGTCLSGGLDSSTIVGVVNRLLKGKVSEAESIGKTQNTFSAIFTGETNNEEKYINEVIKKLGKGSYPIESHKIYPKAEEFFNEIEDFIKTQEEPTISSGPYAQYQVMRLAKGKVTVLLDGQGVDEMMAGYDPYFFVYIRQLYSEGKFLLLINELVNSIDILFKYAWQRFLQHIFVKKNKDPKELMNSAFVEKLENGEYEMVKNNLKQRLVDDIFRNSLQALLRYEDKNAMRFSIEGRVPYLDTNLIKLLFSLPDNAIIQNGWNKFLIRKSMNDTLPRKILKRRDKIGFTTPEYNWFMRMKDRIYSIFLSESFAKRPYFNQREVLKAFQQFLEEKIDDTLLFWRLINVEIWLRIFFDKPTPYNKIMMKKRRKKFVPFEPNENKQLAIVVDDHKYFRFPLYTSLFQKGDDIAARVKKYVLQSLNQLVRSTNYSQLIGKPFFVVVSEKIVAISQGRSYFIWDVKPTIAAKILSNYVTKTSSGIGLGSQWTMQLAIQEIGLPRILLATFVSALSKPFGFRGLFYKIAGDEVASIDGPTEYSLYPSNVSAKLGPKDPDAVAEEIYQSISNMQFSVLKKAKNLKKMLTNFQGVVIIDANDLGRKVLGNSTKVSKRLIEKIFQDNPMGQSDEQTPIVLVFEKE